MTRLETSARSCTSSRQNSSKIDSVRGALQFCESNRLGATRKKGEAIYDIASLFDTVDPGGCLSKPHGFESLMATGTSSPKFGGRKSPYNMENFEEIQPLTVSFSVFLENRDFFLFPTGFFGLVKCDSPFFM